MYIHVCAKTNQDLLPYIYNVSTLESDTEVQHIVTDFAMSYPGTFGPFDACSTSYLDYVHSWKLLNS